MLIIYTYTHTNGILLLLLLLLLLLAPPPSARGLTRM
jgi:hypothetical protein